MNEKAQRVVVLGLGPIGRAVTVEILKDSSMKLVAAVDPSPAFAGKDLSEILGAPERRGGRNGNAATSAKGIRVVPSLDSLDEMQFDVAVHMAGSRFLQIAPQISELVSKNAHVVSTCVSSTEQLGNATLPSCRRESIPAS
jgi:hypothetical protein